MEKTKFEKECEVHCLVCIRQGMDICNLPGHCKEEAELARCGVCGNIYCSEEALTELNVCASCLSRCSQNVDANNEIVNKNPFAQNELLEIKEGSLYEIPVAAKVKFKSKVLECCPGTCCADCCLNFSNECNSFVCHSNNREDKTEVVFKEAKI